jgi:hypothetical protein
MAQEDTDVEALLAGTRDLLDSCQEESAKRVIGQLCAVNPKHGWKN